MTRSSIIIPSFSLQEMIAFAAEVQSAPVTGDTTNKKKGKENTDCIVPFGLYLTASSFVHLFLGLVGKWTLFIAQHLSLSLSLSLSLRRAFIIIVSVSQLQDHPTELQDDYA